MPTVTISTTVLLLASLLTVSAMAAEKQISRAQLPESVRKTADEQAKEATVRKYTTEIENGRREYEVEMTINGHKKTSRSGQTAAFS